MKKFKKNPTRFDFFKIIWFLDNPAFA